MAQQDFQVDRTTALYERPAMEIVDPQTFATVKAAIAEKFSAGNVEGFLNSLASAGLRIRDFEPVVNSGKLGPDAAALYAKLGNGDQGQIREFYLASLERVDMPLRDKYFKLYAYY